MSSVAVLAPALDLHTQTAAARRLECDIRKIPALIVRGKLVGQFVDGRLHVTRASVDRLLAERRSASGCTASTAA